MQEILKIVKKYRFLIFGGLGIVIFLAILDPTVEFILRISELVKKPVVQNEPHWRCFTNVQCGYSVSFPSLLFEHPYAFTNKQHVVFYRQWVSVLGSNHVFMVATLLSSFTNQLSKEQIKLLMDKSMAGAMGKGDTLIYKQDITYGTNVGREFEFQKPDHACLKIRYYRVGPYFQTLTVFVPSADKDSTNAAYFFNSFCLLQK